MADPQMDELDLAALFENVRPSDDYDELAALLGDASPPIAATQTSDVEAPNVGTVESVPSASRADSAVATSLAPPPPLPAARPTTPRKRSGYAWENTHHLLPQEIVTLINRYPAIGLFQHNEFGLVIKAAYLEDTLRKIRRNLKLGNDMFFDAPELESFAPDLKAFNCRIVVKTIRIQPGMVIRFWEHTPSGDLPDKGVYVVRERGFERQGAKR